MTDHKPTATTETVTKAQPAPVSSLPNEMPIADERVGLGKGGGAWLWIAGLAALVIVVAFLAVI